MAVDPLLRAELQVVKHRLEEVQGDIDGARENDSWTAVSSLHRQAMKLELEVARLESAIEQQQGTDEEAALAELARVLQQLPESVLEEQLGVRRLGA